MEADFQREKVQVTGLLGAVNFCLSQHPAHSLMAEGECAYREGRNLEGHLGASDT